MRDWLYARDNCATIDLVLHKGLPGEIYNIGGGNELTNPEITRKILSHLKRPESMIGKPERSLEDTLRETVDWYKQNEDWWGSLL